MTSESNTPKNFTKQQQKTDGGEGESMSIPVAALAVLKLKPRGKV